MERQQEMEKLHKEIAKRVFRLKELKYLYSDSASEIFLFDDELTDLEPDERILYNLYDHRYSK